MIVVFNALYCELLWELQLEKYLRIIIRTPKTIPVYSVQVQITYLCYTKRLSMLI